MRLLGSKFVGKIIKSKLFIAIISPALIAGMAIIAYYSSFGDLVISPGNPNFHYLFYTDSALGGNSQIIDRQVTDSCIIIDFKLNDSIISPYIGVSIADKNDSLLNFAPYNQLNLKVRGNNFDNLGVGLVTPNPFPEKIEHDPTAVFYTTINISSTKKQYQIKLDEFKLPDWWLEYNNIKDAKMLEPDMKNFLRINISNAFIPDRTKQQTLEIYSISFSRNNGRLLFFTVIIEAVFIILVFLFLLFKQRTKTEKKSITINYQPLTSDDKKKELEVKFIDYINNNFHENHLTLELVSKETGISQARISESIQKQFSCNFKSYINGLRINESKRLLIKTELNIGEIAYKVGFNNQSHFNRVFKSMENKSPTEFRKQIK